jgi:hypothetical protein
MNLGTTMTTRALLAILLTLFTTAPLLAGDEAPAATVLCYHIVASKCAIWR